MKHSVQLHSIRHFGDLAAQLELTRACGFSWVETVATHGLPPKDFAQHIARHGLGVSSMHASLYQLRHRFGRLVEACKLVNCQLIVMPYLPLGQRPFDAAGWRRAGKTLGEFGNALALQGIQFAYHNHDYDFLLHDGEHALHWLLSAAEENELGLELDVGWTVRSGINPITLPPSLLSRLRAVHAKDLAPYPADTDQQGWACLGQGVIPWPEIYQFLKQYTDLFVLEHDHPRDAREFLATGHEFMQREFV